MADKIRFGVHAIHSGITTLQGPLQEDDQVYRERTFCCRACERRLEKQRKDEEHRAPCDSDKVKREMCTKPNRMGEYIELSQSRGLWEVAEKADKVTMEELSCAIRAMINEELVHKCTGRAKCPWMPQLEGLREGVDDMLENILMLKLKDYSL